MALLCAAQAVSAQNENPVAESESGFSLSKVTIRPTIGVNIAYETFDGGETGILTSFKVGAIADYAIDHTWGLRTGLLLSGQGGESYHDIGTGTFLAHSLSTRDNPWYLEIPLNAYVDVFTWQNVSFKAFVGFPIEIGLFGKYKLQGEKNPSGVTAGGYEHGCFDKDGLNRLPSHLTVASKPHGGNSPWGLNTTAISPTMPNTATATTFSTIPYILVTTSNFNAR